MRRSHGGSRPTITRLAARGRASPAHLCRYFTGPTWGDAGAQSFFPVLQSELVDRVFQQGYADTQDDLFAYTNGYCSRRRLHSTLGA